MSTTRKSIKLMDYFGIFPKLQTIKGNFLQFSPPHFPKLSWTKTLSQIDD